MTQPYIGFIPVTPEQLAMVDLHRRWGANPTWLTRLFVRWADEERALSLELYGLASWGGYAVG